MIPVDFNPINSLESVRLERAGGCFGLWFNGLTKNGLATT